MQMSKWFLIVSVICLLSGCFARERWVCTDVFSTADAGKSVKTVDASIVSLSYLGGGQRGINLDLDESVVTNKGATSSILLEQSKELPTSVILLKRVKVHFDAAGTPLFLERIVTPVSP